MPSTKISRDEKFLEITILAEKYHRQNKLHPLPCGSPHTYYRFIIMFIIVVIFYFDRFVKPTTNCKTFGEVNDIYRLKMSITSL
jgi:hypothetical protein